MTGQDKEEYELEIVMETDEAFLLTDGIIEEWFPKSQMEFDEGFDIGDTAVFMIPEWLAAKKGLI